MNFATIIPGILASVLSLVAAPINREAPSDMRAVRIHDFGGPEVLKVESIPTPTPGAGELLVRVHAAGVNPIDWKARDGMLRGMVQLPFTLGYDVSGVVEQLGEGVEGFAVGDHVFAYLPLNAGGGYAEYTRVPATAAAKKPASVDHVQAAGVPLAALTAWQALFDTAQLRDGQTVLIHAGAGGVGHFAVQLAKSRGAKVIATASAANLDFLRSIGADQVIDYKSQKFEELVKDVDVVLDPIGGETQSKSIGVIKKGGRLVSIVQPPPADKLKEREITGSVILVRPDGTQLAEIAALIESGKVVPHVSETFPLDQAAKALEKSQTGRTRGKIVLTVAGK